VGAGGPRPERRCGELVDGGGDTEAGDDLLHPWRSRVCNIKTWHCQKESKAQLGGHMTHHDLMATVGERIIINEGYEKVLEINRLT